MVSFQPFGLTELPFGLPGKIYRSPMPFQHGDVKGSVFQDYLSKGILVVVVLAEAEECLQRTGRDLPAFYRANGLEVVECPIADYAVPAWRPLDQALNDVIERASSGKNVAVHCYAGFGRTGTFMACLAHKVLGLNGEEAVKWVRRYIPNAIENEKQVQFVMEFAG
jgi:protein-tyrosine phosphatase